jgi:hypothetical protein
MIRIKRDAQRRIQAFIDNPSNETLSHVIAKVRKNCLLNQLVDTHGQCIEECPGTTPYSIPVQHYGGTFYLYACRPDGLWRLWETNPAEAVLYAIQLLACAKSYVEQANSSGGQS